MMNTSTRRGCGRCLLLLLAVLALPAGAQVGDLRLPISLDADATDYDGKNSMLMFRGLRLSQGNIGVEADFGQASKLDFEDSVWQFSGNVRIDTGNGRVECESADLRFSRHQLRFATITGTPATFELRRRGSGDVTYAEAEKLDYDFTDGVVEFSGNATITEGGNQISSNVLIYNILEQRINAESGANGSDKVKITYTPANDDSLPAAPDATNPEAPPDEAPEDATEPPGGGDGS